MKNLSIPSAILCSLALASCWRGGTLTEPVVDSGSVELPTESEVDQTPSIEVTREGVLEKLGVSIYMEGTHRLLLDAGTTTLLRSQVVNLDDYLNQRVEVTGIERPTVEGDASIINVSFVRSISGAPEVLDESSSSSETVAEAASSSSVKAVLPAPTAPVRSAASSSKAAASSAAFSSAAASSVPSDDQVDDPAPNNATVAEMSKTPVDASTWTQRYCTSHIGFCVPLHKSWWFKSFGATTSYVWHVEVSSREIENLGDGPLLINLVSGSLEGGKDSTLSVEGDYVVGYRSWTDGRHFEISAPGALRSAVDYITRNLTTEETTQE